MNRVSSSKLYVDIDAIKYNIDQIQKFVGESVLVMPIIKADAFGIGISTIAEAVKTNKFIGVADINEANELHKYVPNATVFIMYQPNINHLINIAEMDYQIAVSDIYFIKKLNEIGKVLNKVFKVHLSIDTGLGTIGIPNDDIINYCVEMKKLENVKIVGAFTQYACSESFEYEDVEFSKMQTEKFEYITKIIEQEYGNIKYKHTCCSGAIFQQKNAHFDMVRPRLFNLWLLS